MVRIRKRVCPNYIQEDMCGQILLDRFLVQNRVIWSIGKKISENGTRLKDTWVTPGNNEDML